jgi:hypothetical protein
MNLRSAKKNDDRNHPLPSSKSHKDGGFPSVEGEGWGWRPGGGRLRPMEGGTMLSFERSTPGGASNMPWPGKGNVPKGIGGNRKE